MTRKISILLIMLALVFTTGYAVTTLTASAEEIDADVTVETDIHSATDETIDDSDQDGDEDQSMMDDDSDMEDEHTDDNTASRGGWWGTSEVRQQRQDLRSDRNALLQLFRARKAEFKAQIETRKDDRRDDMQQNRRGLIEARWNMLGKSFANIINRLESRMAKMEEAGLDISEAKAHIENAKASVEAAKAKAAELAASAEDANLTKNAVMKAKANIKADLEKAKIELHLAVQVLVSLRAQSGSDENSDTDGNE